MNFELSSKQVKVRDEIVDFIFSKDSKVTTLIVDQIAGSGKTTTLKKVYNHYKEISSNISKFSVGEAIPQLNFTATTHPAVTQLQNMGCVDAETIHSLLGLAVVIDYEHGGTSLHQQAKPKFPPDTVVIIDEASFIDESVKKYMLQTGLKFVLVGDCDQFLGVENKAEATLPMPCSKTITNDETFRFKDPALAKYVLTLKNNVRNRRIEQIPAKVGYSLYSVNDDAFLNTLMDAFKQAPEECLVITFTNSKVAYYESNIRSELGLSGKVRTGDNLVFKSALRHSMGYRISPNGGKALTKIKVPKKHCKRNILAGRLLQSESIDAIEVWSDVGSSKGTAYLVEDYAPVSKLMSKLKRKKSWSEFYAIKDNTGVANYGYSSTAHGAQGLTIPYTFIDLTDIGVMANIVGKDTIARMIYVSISRASKKVFIRGELPNWLLGDY